ncbi:RNA polymerase sigma factor [Nocardia sp. NPDC050408]|uniref:RNA polymerase sigma factor n=1 Tax=Nocardia sp. NPDC050408 TaxID=3364319 RepID=UPI0037930759
MVRAPRGTGWALVGHRRLRAWVPAPRRDPDDSSGNLRQQPPGRSCHARGNRHLGQPARSRTRAGPAVCAARASSTRDAGRMRLRRRRPPSPFEDLYRRKYPTVRQWLLYAVRGDADRAQDLVQETFIRMWRTYRDRIPEMSQDQVESLLITIAKSCVIDRWRQDSKLIFWEAYVDTDIPVDGVTTGQQRQLDQVLGNDLVGRFFEKASTKLTDGEWRVMFMSVVMERSDPEIAEALCTTVKTVRTHKWSARKKFKAWAKSDGYEITFADASADASVGVGQSAPTTPGIGEVTV